MNNETAVAELMRNLAWIEHYGLSKYVAGDQRRTARAVVAVQRYGFGGDWAWAEKL